MADWYLNFESFAQLYDNEGEKMLINFCKLNHKGIWDWFDLRKNYDRFKENVFILKNPGELNKWIKGI